MHSTFSFWMNKLCKSIVRFAVGGLFVFGNVTASYGQTATGISATAFAELPKDAVLKVRAGRDLPLERDLVVEATKLLTRRGYTVAQRGDVIVTVEGPSPVPGAKFANPNSGEDGYRVLETQRGDSAVQVPLSQNEAKPSAAVFTLRMSAYRPGQSNLWVGSASGPDNGGGRRATTFALAQSLIAVFGQSTPKPEAE